MAAPDHRPRELPWLWIAPTLIAAALIAITLRSLPPSTTTFYPQCPIHTFLHLLCPGCGSTRALAALLRGHLAEALHLNALTTCALPAALAYALYRVSPTHRSPPPLSPATRSILLCLGFGVAAIFTVVRNL